MQGKLATDRSSPKSTAQIDGWIPHLVKTTEHLGFLLMEEDMTTETITTVDTAENRNAPIVSLVVVAILLVMMTAEGMMNGTGITNGTERRLVLVQTNTTITTVTVTRVTQEEEALRITATEVTRITGIVTTEIAMITEIGTPDQKAHVMINLKADRGGIKINHKRFNVELRACVAKVIPKVSKVSKVVKEFFCRYFIFSPP